jgi:uncharacterized protein
MSPAPDGGREPLTWQAFGQAAGDLARAIAADGFEPDLILAIARGGLPLACALGYALAVKDVQAVNVVFYDGVGRHLPRPVMLPPVPDPAAFGGQRVLVVDDVTDTGRTIDRGCGFAGDRAAELRAVAIYEKPGSAVVPDYAWKRTSRWVEFPWSCDGPVVRREGQVLDA